ncbi:hypothetical protein CONCODRAFT_20930 [Conidiobolus coronatus NRRL 28638]|uniref:Dihydrolipoamide acetyltransferase component of pyruvate dehydrogenase complex n=1 Tax=Conidiobolus coronatus (strain ATCC 28846 / CBS 209.66 / NRRL 28638) TaxID=796925 RepID=A0A137NQJ7_CONC2|nr:hypothetical protein CONCODRAFT_20930 [Conidiobolus coronatus NRRL 28638]|eukprot:KXN65021.1 hypothetical protein CONCODRAFT_20930 [Conidiobolus coronatus NRRL 28638]
MLRISRLIQVAKCVTPIASKRIVSFPKTQVNLLPKRQFSHSNTQYKVVPFNLADIGEGITECELIQWFVKEGDDISQFDRICEVQSDKASVEITSRFDGKIKALHYKQGDMAQVGAPLIDIDVSGHIEAESFDAPSSPAKESEIQPSSHPVSFSSEPEKPTKPQPAHLQTFATPAVRRVAKENNVDLSQVTGTGKDGRILKEDVLNYVKNPQAATASTTSAPAQSASTPITQIVEDEIRPLSGIQRAMFKTMTKSLQIPHFGFKEEIVVDPMNLVRKQINEQLAQLSNPHAIKKISYMPIMIKALSIALKDYPVLNSQLLNGEDASKAQLLYRGRHNIGVAMDTPGGLVVPNIKDVQNKSIIEIATELSRLQEAGKTNSISAADLKDGTISLSNIGVIGGTYLSPVVVSTEVCICAVGKIRKLPRFVTETDYLTGKEVEKVIPQNIMEMSWTADHRVIDGATMARFAVRWKSLLENPTSLLAELK